MAEPTHTPPASTGPVKTVRWCSWHDDVADDTVMIDAHERNSGPPTPIYACAACRTRYSLIPLADRPA